MAKQPITRAHPRTIRSGPLAGYTFTTERTYREALAAVRGERYAPPKLAPGVPPKQSRARMVRAYQRQQRDAGVAMSYNQISQSPEFKALYADIKPRKGGTRKERQEWQKRRIAAVAAFFGNPKEFWALYHQMSQESEIAA